MSNPAHDGGGLGWPSAGVLLSCLGLLAAGYGVALLRGPAPAQEVRAVTIPAPTPEPDAVPSAE